MRNLVKGILAFSLFSSSLYANSYLKILTKDDTHMGKLYEIKMSFTIRGGLDVLLKDGNNVSRVFLSLDGKVSKRGRKWDHGHVSQVISKFSKKPDDHILLIGLSDGTKDTPYYPTIVLQEVNFVEKGVCEEITSCEESIEENI